MTNEIQTKKEQVFLSDLQSIVATARRKGYDAVNQIIAICNWLIGRRIVEQEQQGKQRAEYGKRVIKMASEFLTEEFGKGFSVTNLKMKTMTKQDTDGTRCGGNTAGGNSILMGRKRHTYASQVPYLAGLNSMFTKAILLVLLFLVGGARPCGTLYMQRMASETHNVIS